MLNNRFLQEIGIFLELKEEHKEITLLELVDDDPLKFKFNLLIKGFEYHFELLLCRYFPYQPIIIKSLDDNWRSKHQYNDHTMCLKWGIDNWSENLTIKDLVLNLIELIEIENPLGEEHGIASSGDEFSLFQDYNRTSTYKKIFFDKELLKVFKEDGKGVFQFSKKRDYGFFYKIDSNTVLNLIGTKAFEKKEFIYRKYHKKFDNNLKEIDYPKETDSIVVAIYDDKIIAFEIIYFKDTSDIRKLEKKIKTKLKYNPDKPPKYICFPYSLFEYNSEKEKRVNVGQETKLKKIAILGLGSIGSRVLIDLARAGFNNFAVIDDDIFLPYNIVRHELGLEYSGILKAEALTNYIHKNIDESVSVIVFPFALNGQQSSSHTNELLDLISQADLIIDCTADSNLVFSINEVVKKNDINYLSGSIISGGIGNVVTKRCKGSKLSIIDLLESQKCFFSMNNIDQLIQNDYSLNYGDTSYVATMSDCSILSGLIGKMAINMLQNNGENPESDIYIMSTSNSFIGPFYSVYPVLGNKRKKPSVCYNKRLIERGREYYNNYTQRKNNTNS